MIKKRFHEWQKKKRMHSMRFFFLSDIGTSQVSSESEATNTYTEILNQKFIPRFNLGITKEYVDRIVKHTKKRPLALSEVCLNLTPLCIL